MLHQIHNYKYNVLTVFLKNFAIIFLFKKKKKGPVFRSEYDLGKQIGPKM